MPQEFFNMSLKKETTANIFLVECTRNDSIWKLLLILADDYFKKHADTITDYCPWENKLFLFVTIFLCSSIQEMLFILNLLQKSLVSSNEIYNKFFKSAI